MMEVVDLVCARGERRLFQDLSFTQTAGELLYVHGPNGSGKTTLLRTLCGLALPEAGEIRWQGRDIRALGEEYQREMAYVGHLNGVKDELTAVENLQVAGRLSGSDRCEDRAMGALQRLELSACAELPGKVLSQGQKRRLALARLLLAPRTLWIMDEPFNALDVKAVAMIQEILIEHLDNGGMAILTTHQEVEITAHRARHIRLGA
ncbi:MAG: cytochrome c biogenesis heme-transporting ATPase CcmA [Gammaproteobacteria bacterium]|jgi:heme exporter protein A